MRHASFILHEIKALEKHVRKLLQALKFNIKTTLYNKETQVQHLMSLIKHYDCFLWRDI
jgi:hypothetical protein